MSTCNGFTECSARLDELLAEADTALAGADQETIVAIVNDISKRLVQFTAESEPLDPLDFEELAQIERLDGLADRTRRNLVADAIAQSVGSIRDATSDLNKLVKKIKSETARNAAQARTIRLEPIKDSLEMLDDIVAELQEARAALASEGNEATIGSRIGRLAKSVVALRKAIDSA